MGQATQSAHLTRQTHPRANCLVCMSLSALNDPVTEDNDSVSEKEPSKLENITNKSNDAILLSLDSNNLHLSDVSSALVTALKIGTPVLREMVDLNEDASARMAFVNMFKRIEKKSVSRKTVTDLKVAIKGREGTVSFIVFLEGYTGIKIETHFFCRAQVNTLKEAALSKKENIAHSTEDLNGILKAAQLKIPSKNLTNTSTMFSGMTHLPPELLSAMINNAQECLSYQTMIQELNTKHVELKANVIGLEFIENRLEELKKASRCNGKRAAEREIIEGAFKQRVNK